jgi:hypothetical protein
MLVYLKKIRHLGLEFINYVVHEIQVPQFTWTMFQMQKDPSLLAVTSTSFVWEI